MDILSNLSAIGFTEYEAKVYLALLKEYPATGYQISKQAGIPRSMVYEALGRLDVRGAVLKSEARKATLYRPLPPDVLLNRLTSSYARLLDELRRDLNTLYLAQDEGYLWTFDGEDRVLSYAEHMIVHAQREVMLVLADDHLRRLREVIVAADSRGAAIGILLTGEDSLAVGDIAYHPPRESELHKLADSLVVVVDEGEVLIASEQGLNYTATVTTNANMVQIGRQFVWMELFAHRVFSQLDPNAVPHLSADDRSVLESVTGHRLGE